MRLTAVLPRLHESVDVSDARGRAWLEDVYRPPSASFVRLNMITTLTGSAVGPDGTSETISSRVDRAVLGAIRRQADVVLVGAETVRAEGYVMPRMSRLAIVTSTGDLRGHRIRSAAEGERVPLLVCGEPDVARVAAGASGMDAEMLSVPERDLRDGRPTPHGILAALAARGMHSVVCEGGPSLASQFVAAGEIDEACITVAPVMTPVGTPFVRLEGPAAASHVEGMLVDEAGFSYLRVRPSPSAPAREANP